MPKNKEKESKGLKTDKKIKLIDSDSEKSDNEEPENGESDFGLKINKKYAERYEAWRSKEELQKRIFWQLLI